MVVLEKETTVRYKAYYDAHKKILSNPDVNVSGTFLDREWDNGQWTGYGNNNLFFAILTILEIYGMTEGKNTRADETFHWLIEKIQENIGESNKNLKELIEREKELFTKDKSDGENLYKQVLPIIGKIFGIRFFVMTGESALNNRKWETLTTPERDEIKSVGFLRLKHSLFIILIPPVMQTQRGQINRNEKLNQVLLKINTTIIRELVSIFENKRVSPRPDYTTDTSLVGNETKHIGHEKKTNDANSSLGNENTTVNVNSGTADLPTGLFFRHSSDYPFPKSSNVLKNAIINPGTHIPPPSTSQQANTSLFQSSQQQIVSRTRAVTPMLGVASGEGVAGQVVSDREGVRLDKNDIVAFLGI